MAGHRSPSGRRARSNTGLIPARHLIAGRQPAPPAAPKLSSTVLATAAAIGSVATGTFTALLPTADSDTVPTSTGGSSLTTMLAANASFADTSEHTTGGYLTPVAVANDEQADGFAAADQHLALLGKAADIAAQIAEQHAQEQRDQAEHERITAVIDEGGLDGWIAEALEILDLPQDLAPGVKRIIMAESGGNPRAINNWDSNARRGTPSQGLMQTIPSTYRNYVHPELADRPITDPVANITAGIRYMIDHYGIGTLQAGGRSNGSGGYVGY